MNRYLQLALDITASRLLSDARYFDAEAVRLDAKGDRDGAACRRRDAAQRRADLTSSVVVSQAKGMAFIFDRATWRERLVLDVLCA